MRQIHEDYCAQMLGSLRNQKTCDWCKDFRVPAMPRTGLCNRCNAIKKKLRRVEAQIKLLSQAGKPISLRLDRELHIQRSKAESAKSEGQKYGAPFDADLTDTTLESEFRFISKHAAGKDFFYGLTNFLNYGFGINQRRYIFYLLSSMSREIMRRSGRDAVRYQTLTDESETRAVGAKPED